MMKQIIIDIETERLIDPETLWVVVTKDVETKEVNTWVRPDLKPEPLLNYIKGNILIGHNILGFDIPQLSRFLKHQFNPEQVIDTVVVSRLLDSWSIRDHSLDAWGERLGTKKLPFKAFDQLSQEMITYCQQDVEVTYQLFKVLSKYIFDPMWSTALRNEHRSAIICQEISQNGFSFNVEAAEEIYNTIKAEHQQLEERLQIDFPPKFFLVKEVNPVLTKTGKLHSKDFRWLGDGDIQVYSAGQPFSLIQQEPFNPRSPKQVIERLWACGWNPTEKTKGHIKAERNKEFEKLENYKTYGWTISEENLKTLPADAPEATKYLVRFLLLSSRLSTLTEWLEAVREDKRIHGQILHIGTKTHRCSHSKPNMGNVPSLTAEFGHDMRALWKASDGYKLVGCDAEGIQLRILAHYMNDPEFTIPLVEGSSKDGTDVHTKNMKLLRYCKSRDDAKTFIYSWILGASVVKTAAVLGCTVPQAAEARDRFLETYKALKVFKENTIVNDAKRGYLIGIDGRKVKCDSEHHMLAVYLQNAEKIIMTHANWLWREAFLKEKIDFRQVNFVHDEWQTEIRGDDELIDWCARVQAASIKKAGEDLKLNCPLAGSYKVGFNWADTH